MPIVDDTEVWAAVRDWRNQIIGVSPNIAYPLTWGFVLAELERITALAEAANEARPRPIPDPGPDQIDRDLQRWRIRLEVYKKRNAEAPAPDDRRAVLWHVTAPLLLGQHGGPTGTEIPIVQAGFPPGFDPTVDIPPDIMTPYTLANQLEIAEAFERENRERTVQEIKERAQAAVEGVGKWWPWAVGGVVVVGVVGAAIYVSAQARALAPARRRDAA